MNEKKVASELVNIAKLVSTKKQAAALNDEFVDLRKEFGDKGAKEILDDLRIDADDLDTFEEDKECRVTVYRIEAGNEEWVGFKSDSDAITYAEDYVKDMLDDEPELFSKNWLKSYIQITDTDRRIIANEDADSYIGEMTDEEILEYADLEDEYQNLQDEVDELESEWSDADEEWDQADDSGDDEAADKATEKKEDIQSEIDKLNKEMEKFIDNARDQALSDYYDQVYNGLADPYEYFVEKQGIYSAEDLMKASFIYIDTEEAAEDAVSVDGAAHFIS